MTSDTTFSSTLKTTADETPDDNNKNNIAVGIRMDFVLVYLQRSTGILQVSWNYGFVKVTHQPKCHIHWRYVQRKNVVNNVGMSSLKTPWQMASTKTNTQNDKTRRTPWRNRHLENNYRRFSHERNITPLCCVMYSHLVTKIS